MPSSLKTSHQHHILILTPEWCQHLLGLLTQGKPELCLRKAEGKAGNDPVEPGLKVTAGTRERGGDKMEGGGQEPRSGVPLPSSTCLPCGHLDRGPLCTFWGCHRPF